MKTLGETDDNDDSTVSWLKKFDVIQEEKEKAERRVPTYAYYLRKCTVCIIEIILSFCILSLCCM